MDRRKQRIHDFVEFVTSAQIRGQTDHMTSFHTMLTKEEFENMASKLSDKYVLYFAYNVADEKPRNPPTYHYIVILEEKDNNPPFEYPNWLKPYQKK